jgi:hypothetical protein
VIGVDELATPLADHVKSTGVTHSGEAHESQKALYKQDVRRGGAVRSQEDLPSGDRECAGVIGDCGRATKAQPGGRGLAEQNPLLPPPPPPD